MLRKYANDKPFLTLIPEELTDDIFTRLDAYCQNFSDYLNNKQTVPENTQLIFLLCFNASSDINNLFGLFFDEIKKIHIQNRINTKKTNQILTPKEMKKFNARELVTLSKTLDFATPNEARLHGFYGQQCSNCKGFRTKITNESTDKVYCVQCHNLKNVPIMSREHFITCPRCRFILDHNNLKEQGTCPHCSFELVLPVEMH